LFELLDGPERALSRRLEQAALNGGSLALTIALRGRGMAWLAAHPAIGWRWELLTDEHGPVMVRRERTLAVQLGDTRLLEPRTLAHSGLRILFMAYSPQGVQPELDFEGEEERLLGALAPFIEDGRAQVVVVEFGSLADLGKALLGREFDVVHLSGHGMLDVTGPRLVMENHVGNVDRVSPARLLESLEQAGKMPELVMISSCLSAGERDGIPSLTAQLVAGGVPAAIGWIQPIRDDLATQAAADIYQRLCVGQTPAQAVAFARARLHAADLAGTPQQAANAWGTLHLITRDAAGFVVDRDRPRPNAELIGRRRPLQRVLRVLIDGTEAGLRRAGAVIFGNKGTGKSCLAARAIQRLANGLEDPRELGVIALHGQLDDALLFTQLEYQSLRWGDEKAQAILRDSSRGTVVERARHLLAGHWSRGRLVIVLDDFEQNLEAQTEGLATLSLYAAELLDVLLPACRATKAKLLVTTTARFKLPTGEAMREPLIEVGLGGFDPSSLRKLWLRGQIGEGGTPGDLVRVGPSEWSALCDRLGRNPRILDWARTLLSGKSSRELQEVAARFGEAVPEWTAGEVPEAEQQDELARLFLRHMAYDEAIDRISEDARTFVRRARVYEFAVPREALEGLCEGLAIDLELHLPALQNLGLLEFGELDGEPAQRVSALVEPMFAAEDAERWHSVAAEFWIRPEKHCGQLERMMMAWEHALAGRCQRLAAAISLPISVQLDAVALYRESLRLAKRHLLVFPDAEVAMAWIGYAACRAGDPVGGWRWSEKAETSARARGASDRELAHIFGTSARVLTALGRFDDAAKRLRSALDLQERLDETENSVFACLFHDLGRVLHSQGDLCGARHYLERSLSILLEIFGTHNNLMVGISLHELARVLYAQGDLCGARQRFEHSLSIKAKVLGTDEHPEVAVSLNELAHVLTSQGDISGARQHLEHSLSIKLKVFGTEEHASVAISLGLLAGVLKDQGDLSDARELLERSMSIQAKVFGTDEHPDVASSLSNLAGLLEAEGRINDAIETLRRVLQIQAKLYRTRNHYISAETEVELARLLHQTDQTEESVGLLNHAMTVFSEQVPNHPILAELRQVFGEAPNRSVLANPSLLARLALRACNGTSLDEADQRTLDEGLETLAAAGPPYDTAAAHLRAVAGGTVLPSLPADLPQPVAQFLASVRDAAQSLNDRP
jgi:tetratricopeptide (TPR) repeat protein